MVKLMKACRAGLRRTTLCVGVAVAALAGPALAQMRPGPVVLTTHPLRGGAYWITGGRSNTGFVVGPQGVVVLDTEIPDAAAKMQVAEIAKVTSEPVSAIVVTHADPDHVGGLLVYPTSTPVLMQENARSEVVASANDPAAPPMYKALYANLAERLPLDTIGSQRTLTLGGVHVALMHFGPAHTAGDIIMYLPDQKIVYGGDILVNYTRFPVIHLGGSSLGWEYSMKALLALDADTYVPGHGPILPKAELASRLRDEQARREQIKAMVVQGKTLPEIQQALPDKTEVPMFITYTEAVYAELTRGFPPPNPPWDNVAKRPHS